MHSFLITSAQYFSVSVIGDAIENTESPQWLSTINDSQLGINNEEIAMDLPPALISLGSEPAADAGS